MNLFFASAGGIESCTGVKGHDKDCLKKKFSIKVKKKSKKKGRWPSRRIKTWYIYNNNIVFLFMKKLFSYLDFSGRYGHFNV